MRLGPMQAKSGNNDQSLQAARAPLKMAEDGGPHFYLSLLGHPVGYQQTGDAAARGQATGVEEAHRSVEPEACRKRKEIFSL